MQPTRVQENSDGDVVSIESCFVELETSASTVPTSSKRAPSCHHSMSWSFATPCFSKRSKRPRITTRRYVPTLRTRKLGSTGVEIRWSISGRLDLSGANLPPPPPPRPGRYGKCGDALTPHRITRGDRALQNAGIIEIQPLPVTSKWH